MFENIGQVYDMAISQALIPKSAINFHKKKRKEKHAFGNLVV